jgi:Flp pilus assembly protein TadD
MKKITITSLAALAVLVSACGETKSDRALSGGAIGAGVGAVGSSLVGGNAIGGALIGGAVGAGAGALTDKKDVDLGSPVWRR